MRTRDMMAALLLLTTLSGAAWGQCIDLYKTPAGSWGWPGGKATFSFQQDVVRGDTVTFIVLSNGLHLRADDLLGFRVHVTPVP